MNDLPGGPLTDLLSRSARGLAHGVRKALSRVDRRIMFAVWGGGALVIFVGVVLLSIADSPDVIGVLRGLGVGLFTALLFAVAMGWLVVSLYRPRVPSSRAEPKTGELDRLLAPVLRELDATRAEISRTVRRQSMMRIPLGVAAAVLLWVVMRWSTKPPDAFDLVIWAFLGALAGEISAIAPMDRQYKRLFKARVLPHLARQFGDLTYRPAAVHDVATLQQHGILPPAQRVTAEDEIAGTHHGMPVSIVEARLVQRSGKKRHVVFDGLLVELTLPRALDGTTVIRPDGGAFRNLAAQWRTDGLERVRLEDPRFEGAYEVYSDDQIQARALLTPRFMERLMALTSRGGVALPGAIARGNRLIVAIPKRVSGDLFEPPSYWKASGGTALAALSADIQMALGMVDAITTLDFWAAGRASQRPRP